MGNSVADFISESGRDYDVTQPIEFDIDLEHIQKGIQDWEQFIDAFETGFQSGIEELGYKMKDKLIDNISNYGLGDSNLINTIFLDILPMGIYLEIGADYAVYLEYGTGTVGQNSIQHPTASMDGWVYDKNNHGEDGWWYPTTENDPNKKKKRSKEGGLWGWTKGQESKPFMYDTVKWAKSQATKIIRRHIRNEIKRVSGVR